MPVQYGEFSRQQAYEAVWQFLHDLSLDEAFRSQNPLHQMFAVIDSRMGKRRLREIDSETLHPLVKALLLFRLEASKSKADASPD